MKPLNKILILFLLFIFNLIIYYYLAENAIITPTFKEIKTTLLTSFIAIPIISLLPALFIYLLRLNIQKKIVTYKNVYLKIYLNTSIAVYTTMLFIGVFLYFK